MKFPCGRLSSTTTASFLLTTIIAIGVVLRSWHITWGLPGLIHRWPYHADEAEVLLSLLALRTSSLNFAMFIWGLGYMYFVGAALVVASWAHQVVLIPSVAYYNQHIFELRKIYLVGRWVSVAWSTLTIYLAYLLGKHILNRRAGLLSAFFIAILPFGVIHAHFMTPHMQFTALTMTALFFGAKIIETGRGRWFILFGLATGLAIVTYSILGATVFAMLPLAFVRKNWSKTLLALCTIGVTVLLVQLKVISDFQGFLSAWQQMLSQDVKPTFNIVMPLFKIIRYGIGTWLFIASLFGIGWGLREKNKPVVRGLLIWIGIYICAVTFSGQWMWVRRFGPVILVMVVLAANSFVAYNKKYKQRALVRGIVLSAGFVSIMLTMALTLALVSAFSHDTRDQAHAWINANVPPGRSFAIQNWFHIPHLDLSRYQVRQGVSPQELESLRFDYYLVSNFEVGASTITPTDQKYYLARIFSASLEFWGIRFDYRNAPEDMRMATQDIYLFARSGI